MLIISLAFSAKSISVWLHCLTHNIQWYLYLAISVWKYPQPEKKKPRPIFRYFMLGISIIRPEIHLYGDKTCNDLPPPHACSRGYHPCKPYVEPFPSLANWYTVRNLMLFSAGARKKNTNQIKNSNCLIRSTGNLSVSPYAQNEYRYLLNTASRGENRQGLAHCVQIRFLLLLSRDRDKRLDPHSAQPRLNFSGLRFWRNCRFHLTRFLFGRAAVAPDGSHQVMRDDGSGENSLVTRRHRTVQILPRPLHYPALPSTILVHYSKK